MGGDGMSGLAAAIGVIMIAMVVGGFALAFFLGRGIAERSGAAGGKASWIGLAIGLVGLGAGVLAVFATFYESAFSPPPAITLNLPLGYAHQTFVMLEDPAATTTLTWRGSDLIPFFGRTTALDVPAKGGLRIKDLGPLSGRGDAKVRWSDGSETMGFSGGPAPAGLNATSYAIFHRGNPSAEDVALSYDPDKLAAFIRQRADGG